MADPHFYNRDRLNAILRSYMGKTLGEADVNNVFRKTVEKPKITGIAGDVVEQSILGYPQDSDQRPDLNVDGVLVEVKTTGIRKSKHEKDKYEAKEPMSITAVSPAEIVYEEFDTSHFWEKLAHLLVVYYLYDSDKPVLASEYARFPLKGYDFYSFSDDDKEILKHDWTIVRDFIIHLQNTYDDYESEYPRISSELRPRLLYIDTAPKWPNKPRFRLKRSVVTTMWESYCGREYELIMQNVDTYDEFDNECHSIAKKYRNHSVSDILATIDYFPAKVDKSIMEKVVIAMFGGKSSKMSDIELFSKMGLVSKTIVITQTGKRTEDTKFVGVDFDEFQDSELAFEDSNAYEYFYDRVFLFSVFQEPHRGAKLSECIFLGFKRYSFNDGFINSELKRTWERLKYLIQNNKLVNVVCTDRAGNPIINPCGTIKSAPNFPKSSEGTVFLRGTAADSRGKKSGVNGIPMTSQNYWIKGLFLVDELSKLDYL